MAALEYKRWDKFSDFLNKKSLRELKKTRINYNINNYDRMYKGYYSLFFLTIF